eukprot:4423661-Amphidinium_carterae.1
MDSGFGTFLGCKKLLLSMLTSSNRTAYKTARLLKMETSFAKQFPNEFVFIQYMDGSTTGITNVALIWIHPKKNDLEL